MKTLPLGAPDQFKSGLHPDEKEGLWYLFSKEKIALHTDSRSLPTKAPSVLLRSLYMGTYKGKNLFAGEILEGSREYTLCELRELHGILSEEHFALAGRALQLLDWDRTHKFCGVCGSLTLPKEEERCRECPSCGHLAYPKLAPAIMALVKKGSKLLLARGKHFPPHMYSVLAGFVDVGETLEQCVEREVFEEVGVRVKNITYFGSQPWPFSRSFMIAFVCEWESGEIKIDPSEIEHAAWFDPQTLPLLPPPFSIARIMIDRTLCS